MVSYYLLGSSIFTLFLLNNYFLTGYAQLENNSQPPEVTISQGTLLGTILTTRKGRNVSAFLGIPYGKPPIGDLRFANPLPADGWNDTLDASVAASRCPQYESNVLLGEEDCLYLNVYTPWNTTNSSLLPIMVYIHGGGYTVEYPRINGPDYILDADVLLVLLYYRLGPLGFLSTGDEVASGNWGLKDQALGLQWVQDNIEKFGGDPDQVTIFGESAGSVSVHHLTLSNRTIGLFHKYITQSGSALETHFYVSASVYANRAYELGEAVGCSHNTSKSLISCLRTVEFSQFAVSDSFCTAPWSTTEEPDIEGAIITDSVVNLYAAGKIRDLPHMAGVVRNEGLLYTAAFYANETLLHDFMENIDTRLPGMLGWTYRPDPGAAFLKAVKSYYFNNDLTSNTSLLLENLTMLFGDAIFNYPTINAIRQQSALVNSPQYLYSFDYRGVRSWTNFEEDSADDDYGVTHADDLIYLFPMDQQFSSLNSTMSQTDYQMVDTIVQLWTSFAINGTPTASALNGSATWKPYSTELENYLRIGGKSDLSLELLNSLHEDRMQFWANIEATVDSGAVTSSLNFLIPLLIACSKLVPF